MDNTVTESYEVKNARERAENWALHDKQVILLHAVAKALGWSVKKEREADRTDYRPSAGIEIVNGLEGLYLSIGSYGNPEQRIGVSGQYPRDAKGQHINAPYNEEFPRITVSSTKTPEQIAKDITRRLLPEYRRLLAYVTNQATQANNYEAASVGALQIVKGFALDEWEAERKQCTIEISDGVSAQVQALGAEVKLELHYLTAPQALGVIEYLKGGKP